MFKRLRSQEGASAVEFALICPLFFLLVFAIISFGIGFMQLQTARGAVREGARAQAVMPATGTRIVDTQQVTMDASSGLITNKSQVTVDPCSGAGDYTTVSYNTQNANGGTGIVAQLIFFQVPMNSTVTAKFLCEG